MLKTKREKSKKEKNMRKAKSKDNRKENLQYVEKEMCWEKKEKDFVFTK